MTRSFFYRILFGVLCGMPWWLAGCGGDQPEPTRTPIPTWTSTPVTEGVPADAVTPAEVAQTSQPPAPATPAPVPDTPTHTPEPPTATPLPLPTDTVTPAPTPTETLTPEPPTPTPTPVYAFELETAEKFPTESLAVNMVRIYLYVYSPSRLGLGDYQLSVRHNGVDLPATEVSQAGLPALTRKTAGPFSRFTNLNVLFVEPQLGRWEVQVVDKNNSPAGPSTVFELTANESTRELYVRYRLK